MAIRPGGAMVQGPIPTRSQLLPLLSNWKQLRDKSQLGAMIVTVIAILAMYAYIGDSSVFVLQTGDNPEWWIYSSKFLILVGAYLTLLSLYFVYRLAGKRKSWLVLVACFAFTCVYMWLEMVKGDFNFIYHFFHITLAGGEPDANLPFTTLFFRHFVGTGFFEEFVKAIPLLILLFWTPRMQVKSRDKFGINEPLDGVLLGAASAGGFAFMETILQYVSHNLFRTWLHAGMAVTGLAATNGQGAWKLVNIGMNLVGAAPGAQLLIPRSLDETFGHMAYSGYFGYFIGLAALKPQRRWVTLGIGYASASLCHALWDSVDNSYLEVVIGLLSYAVLAAAILKAREISPNRFLLQPSVVFGAVAPNPPNPDVKPVPPRDVAGSPSPVDSPAKAAPAAFDAFTPPNANGIPQLRIGSRVLVVVPGLRILEHQAPGLHPQSPGGPIAEVTRNPHDPSVLGLTNLSSASWEIVTARGNRHQIPTGQTIKLSPGTKIDFGVLDGEVR